MGDLDTKRDARLGVRLANRYVIEERLSSGGMATVYRATDEILGRPVAVKIMHPALAADPSFVERFRQEGQHAASLSHPNVVTVYDYGEATLTSFGQPDLFMVMELVEGTTLRSLLDRFGRLDPPMARHVARGVAAALDHAHSKGIVHRDVKPENVLLTPDGQVKVVDFGIAKALGPHAVNLTTDRPIGTVAYVAPEQITASSAVDARADVYALGAMTYEMVTGRPPFHGDTPQAVAAARMAHPTLVAGVSQTIDEAIARATAADPDDRYDSPGDFARALGDAGEPAFNLSTDHLPDAAAVAKASTPAFAHRDPIEVLPFQTRLHRTKKRRFRVAAFVALTLALAAIAVYIVIPKPTAVPDLRGDTLEEAKAQLERDGLLLGDVNHQFHDVAAEGTVFGTDPDPGTAVKQGVKIALLVSKGPQMFDVPDIVGEPFEDAKAMMSAANFTLTLGSRKHHDDIPKDAVISYGPPREQAKRGQAFSATVSDGPELVDVPNVNGMSTTSARKAIEGAGFTFGTSTDYSDSVVEGNVIRTEPGGGGKAPKGSRITAVVSKGPRPFAMPDLVGMRLGAAKEKARGLGLVVRNEYPVPGSGKAKGTVQGQNPVSGTMVRRGTPIDIYYSN